MEATSSEFIYNKEQMFPLIYKGILTAPSTVLVTPFSYPPLVLTQEKWGDVAVIFDQIANWFPRTGPSQVRESWPCATASSCQAPQWDPRQACPFDFCEIDEEHVFMSSEGRQRDKIYLQAKFLYCSCFWLLHSNTTQDNGEGGLGEKTNEFGWFIFYVGYQQNVILNCTWLRKKSTLKLPLHPCLILGS